MARILGLDLGSYSVKGLLLDSGSRSTPLRGWAEVRRGEGERLDTLRAAVRELLASEALRGFEQVVVALPGPSLATHAFSLPFSDPKRLESTVPYEVESQLPFDLSQAVFDYQVVAQGEKGSELLVGVVRKEELTTLLQALGEAGVDPRVVTHPGIAYQNLLLQHASLFEAAADAGAVAVLDVGHERTTVAIGKAGTGVEFARTFAGGGRDLSRALANEFQTPLPEAHHWKESHGALGAAVAERGPDAQRAAGAFVRGLQPLLRELRPTLKSYSARSRRSVGAVYLCGGSARLPGLDEQLTQDLGVPVRVLSPPATGAPAPLAEAGPAAAQAWALAVRGSMSGGRAPRFNLRRGDLAFKADFDYVKERLGLLAAFAATLLLLLVASGLVRNSVLARRERQVDAVLCDVTQRVLGTCERNYDRALNLLRGQASPAAALPRLSALDLLAEMTQRVPEDVPVRFDRIQVDLDRITVQGETDSSKQIDDLAGALKGFRCFREVKEGKVEKTRDSPRLSFRMDIQVECPAAAGEGET